MTPDEQRVKNATEEIDTWKRMFESQGAEHERQCATIDRLSTENAALVAELDALRAEIARKDAALHHITERLKEVRAAWDNREVHGQGFGAPITVRASFAAVRKAAEAGGIAEAALSPAPDWLAKQIAKATEPLESQIAELKKTFRCFHCGFETANPEEARGHFGEMNDDEFPFCVYWSELSADERTAQILSVQKELDAEREENAVQRQRIEGLEYQVDGISAAVSSRFKGCSTIDEAWHSFDFMEGLKLVAESQVAALVAAGKASLDSSGGPDGCHCGACEKMRSVLANTAAAATARDEELRRKALDLAIVLAEGCHDYGGGHRDKEYDAFQHGISTVVNVLRKKRDGDDSYQMRVVEAVGREAEAARKGGQ